MKWLLVVYCVLFSCSISMADYAWEQAASKNVLAVVQEYKGKIYGGTGFALKYKDKIWYITARHVCVSQLTNEAPTGAGNTTQVSHAGINILSTETDLCTLKLSAVNGVPPVVIEGLSLSSKEALAGDSLVVWGHPKLKPLTRAVGKIIKTSNLPKEKDITLLSVWYPLVETDVKIERGSSGSPVLNTHGEVIGVITNISKDGKRSYFVPLTDLKKFLDGEN